MTQYAKIAEAYSKNEGQKIEREFMYEPTFFEVIGDLNGLDVIDLGCGTGKITRQLKQRGARKVIGVDEEQEMLRFAIEEEKGKPLGITYYQGKVGRMQTFGKFDLVTAAFLLHYAETRGELEAMCQDIYKNLKTGGRFVGINENSDHPLTSSTKYGATSLPLEPLGEGSRVQITICVNGVPEFKPFTIRHWAKQTYEDSLYAAGFKEVVWHPMKVSREGIEKFGEDYWKDWFKESPHLIVMEARK